MKKYFVRKLSNSKGISCIYLPPQIRDIGFLNGKYVKMIIDNEKEELIITKIKELD